MKNTIAWTAVLFALALVAVLFWLPGDQITKIKLATAYAVLILIFFSGMIVLLMMATGAIDLTYLLGEHGGGASMSRFQLLIFTFVVSLSFFLLVVEKHSFPVVPSGVLALLGISATTYAVSKGIQAGSDLPGKEPDAPANSTPGPAPSPAPGSTPSPSPGPTPGASPHPGEAPSHPKREH